MSIPNTLLDNLLPHAFSLRNKVTWIPSSILVFISDTRTAKRSIAWSSGIGTAKGSNGMTVPAASRLSSCVKCSDQFARKARARETKCAGIFARKSLVCGVYLKVILEETACDVLIGRPFVSVDLAR